ncbi:MAG: VOC family protein [Firmicutes bacterium]|nr:VOC family protein [Bacillota bacterium]
MIKGIAHLAFAVNDMEESLQFYVNGLGFQKAFVLKDALDNPMIVYLSLGTGQFIELFFKKQRLHTENHSSYEHFCLEVDNIFEFVASLESKKIKIVSYPEMGLDNNYQCWIEDPDSNRIEIMQYTPDSLQLKAIQN